jgi:hypothetical protein
MPNYLGLMGSSHQLAMTYATNVAISPCLLVASNWHPNIFVVITIVG